MFGNSLPISSSKQNLDPLANHIIFLRRRIRDPHTQHTPTTSPSPTSSPCSPPVTSGYISLENISLISGRTSFVPGDECQRFALFPLAWLSHVAYTIYGSVGYLSMSEGGDEVDCHTSNYASRNEVLLRVAGRVFRGSTHLQCQTRVCLTCSWGYGCSMPGRVSVKPMP